MQKENTGFLVQKFCSIPKPFSRDTMQGGDRLLPRRLGHGDVHRVTTDIHLHFCYTSYTTSMQRKPLPSKSCEGLMLSERHSLPSEALFLVFRVKEAYVSHRATFGAKYTVPLAVRCSFGGLGKYQPRRGFQRKIKHSRWQGGPQATKPRAEKPKSPTGGAVNAFLPRLSWPSRAHTLLWPGLLGEAGR